MNDLQILIEQMVSDISSQSIGLDDLRLRLFLNWLSVHNSQMKTISDFHEQVGDRFQKDVVLNKDGNIEERLKTGLKAWFETLPMQGLLWEYRIILDEIAWWRDLDQRRLTMILEAEEKQGDGQTIR